LSGISKASTYVPPPKETLDAAFGGAVPPSADVGYDPKTGIGVVAGSNPAVTHIPGAVAYPRHVPMRPETTERVLAAAGVAPKQSPDLTKIDADAPSKRDSEDLETATTLLNAMLETKEFSPRGIKAVLRLISKARKA
jgi:hypothetical protein